MEPTVVPKVDKIDHDKYDLVEVLPSGAILLKDKVVKTTMGEIGSSGMTSYGAIYREEYNSTLRGHTGRMKYNQMRKSDGQVRAVLRLVKTPVLAARWYIAPASDKRRDIKISEFVDDCFFRLQSSSFPQMMTEILTMLDFGFSAFEKVWKYEDWNGTKKVVWQKLAQRHALDVTRWNYDSTGGPESLLIYDPNNSSPGNLEIPISKLLAFTFEREGGDFDGVSVLRPAYKHWYYKENLYKVDAIQKERHGIGIPVIKLPAGFTEEDKKLANEMGRNLRTNEKAHIVLPPNWEISMLKMEGQPVDAMTSIEHHDLLIAREILGQFINASAAAASQETMQTLFLKSTRYIADTIRDVFNKWAIPELVRLNFPGVEEYPQLKARRIGDTMDWRTVSFAIRNFIGSGVIIPDDRMETWIRDEMDLPPVEMATKRIIVAPLNSGNIPDGNPDANPGPGGAKTSTAHQNGGIGGSVQSGAKTIQAPGKATNNSTPGASRQSQAGNMDKSPGSNGRVGQDKAGK